MFITFKELGNYGRLGNQMFQYATIRNVSIKNNLEIKIPRGNYDILRFNICKNYLSKENYKIFDEKYYHFDQEVLSINYDCSLFGYFQSYKYFDEIRYVLINEFSCNLEKLAENIVKNHNKITVSIHVRREDYLKYPDIHPVCSKKYYNCCMEYFNKKYDCVFLVFSDDLLWCKQNIIGHNVFYYNYDTVIDLLIMSKCDHNIIANSSYSWWAAYLNQNKNKEIKYPNIWFGKNGPSDTFDLFPLEWDKIQC